MLNWLRHFNSKLDQILINQEKIMSALSDIQAQMAALVASFSAELAAITAALTAAQQVPDGTVAGADVEAIVVQMKTLQDAVDKETAALAPATPPAAPTS
jgi:hypothetical protein